MGHAVVDSLDGKKTEREAKRKENDNKQVIKVDK